MRYFAVNAALGGVILFGLCGAFLARLIDFPKVHYIPLAVAIGIAAFSIALHRPFLWLLMTGTALGALGVLYIEEQNALLSYFAVVVLPLVWFCAG
jgi:hypothetical protein